MSVDLVARLDRVTKSFKLYSSAAQRLADWLRVPPTPRYGQFFALRDISFEVRRGECLGIIGPNGAGKSTLLKLLTGVLYPTSGAVEVHGRVLSLLELGTGFAPDLTGRQNIEHSARMLGFPGGYAAARVEDIRAFAEIGEYFDRPVKFYSSGMLVRLAFALFSTMQPEVFLVDEALAVGDLRFAARALSRIRQMVEQGTTLLFVSHDLQLVNQLCTRAIWLHAGTLQMDAEPSEVTRAYQQFVVHGAAERSSGEPPQPVQQSRTGLSLGSGWHPLEAFGGEVFRWAGAEAEIMVEVSESVSAELVVDLEAASVPGGPPARLLVVDEWERALAQVELTSRSQLRVPLTMTDNQPYRVYLRSDVRTYAEADDRELSFRIFGLGWSDEPDLLPVAQVAVWVDSSHDLDLNSELASMHRAVRRSAPVPGAAGRIGRVCTRSATGAEAVRFGTHEPLHLEVTIEGLTDLAAPVVGVQVRDTFDRLLWTTRTDWQGRSVPPVAAGESLTVSFETQRLLLGRGLYQLTVALHEYPNDGHVFHWIDGAWKFEVVEAADVEFKGVFDLDWHYVPVSRQGDHAIPALSRR